jgi:hypothetical protein
MVATQRRRAGPACAAAAGALVVGGTVSVGAGTTAPHGQLLQAADGTLYLLVAGSGVSSPGVRRGRSVLW